MRIMKVLLLVMFIAGLFQANMYAKISSRVEGVVTDKDTGEPIEGAKITLHFGYMGTYNFVTNHEIEWETVTNSKGYFRFNIGIPLTRVNEFYVQCVKKDYISSIPELYETYSKSEFVKENFGVFRLNEGQIKYLKIELEKGGTLKGKIFKKETSGTTPCSVGGFLERKSNPDEEHLKERTDYQIAYIETDASGEFEIDGIEPYDNYYITIVPNGYPVKFIEGIVIQKNSIRIIEPILDFTNRTGIEGTIMIGQQVAESGSVHLLKDIPLTQLTKNDGCIFDIYENGIYSCKGLNPGTYSMKVSAWNKIGSFSKEYMVEIKEGITKVFDIIF